MALREVAEGKFMNDSVIRLANGSGAGLQELLGEIVLPALLPDGHGILEDAAIIDDLYEKIAFTSDSFVVWPLEFRGGDIGKLAACGTINDLAMMGALARYMSVSLILEEGLEKDLLSRILRSLREACEESGVSIVCGDTKVVDKGKADGMFISTSGIGVVPSGRNLSAANAKSGDIVLVSGPIGLHGITILSERRGLGFASAAVSDCAALGGLVEVLLAAAPETKVLRDATRGGCAAVLHELAQSSNVTIMLDESLIPVPEVVKGACSFLGLDPLHIANEGRFVAIVPPRQANAAIAACNAHALGKGAACIGTVCYRDRFPVLIKTSIGGTRPVEMPAGELLPRIC
jgi:hydrogenase expression/formation protein HypE